MAIVPPTGPDLGAVGNAAQVSKQTVSRPKELASFSVKKGDNGGIIVSESYETKAPEGRRASSFLGGNDYKENPFSPDDGAKASSHITGLLSQMGVTAPAPTVAPKVGVPPMLARPTATVARGPNVTGVRGPAGGGGLFKTPDLGGGGGGGL